jgi:hypothetical protein
VVALGQGIRFHQPVLVISRRLRSESGMVVAETALALPAVALIVWLCAWVLTVAGSQLRLEDAARVVSRGAAMGLADDVLLQRAMQVSPDITVAIDGDGVTTSGGLMRVTLSRPLHGPGLLPDLTLVATATTVREAP